MKKYLIILFIFSSYIFIYSIGVFNGYKISSYIFIPQDIYFDIKYIKHINENYNKDELEESIYKNIYMNMYSYKKIMEVNNIFDISYNGYSLLRESFMTKNKYKKDFSLYCSSIYIRENSKNSTYTDLANSYIEIFENETR